MKIFVNLFFIRETNGLFHYANNILRERILTDNKVVIIANKNIGQSPMLKREGAKNNDIMCLNFLEFIFLYTKLIFSQEKIITPTFHPLPFLRNQLVVMHDHYPYLGWYGLLKLHILRTFLRLSRTTIAVINKSLMIPFILNASLVKNKNGILFMPNFIDVDEKSKKKMNLLFNSEEIAYIRVGLAGTDSPKKNYEDFFLNLPDNYQTISFKIYGKENEYYRSIIKKFPKFLIELIDSDVHSPMCFISEIDLLCQVNDMEGFGRINGFALLGGLPVLALESPVNNEFFMGAANLYPTLNKLILAIYDPDQWIKNPSVIARKSFLKHRDQCSSSLVNFLDQ